MTLRNYCAFTATVVAALEAFAMAASAGQVPAPETTGKSLPATSMKLLRNAGETGMGEPFNPARCNGGDKNFVYWAARDQVFRFRFDAAQPINPQNEWNGGSSGAVNLYGDIPPAPDPTEAEGCYGNPLRGVAVPYMQKFATTLLNKLAGREVERRTDRGTSTYGPVPEHLHRFSENEVSAGLFNGSKNCWQRSSGIFECLTSPGTDRDDYRIRRALKIEAVLLPKNREARDVYLTIGYDTASMASPVKDNLAVDSQFRLYDAVRLHDHFRIFPNEIDLLIPYFGGLIPYVTNAHVPGYRWAPAKTK